MDSRKHLQGQLYLTQKLAVPNIISKPQEKGCTCVHFCTTYGLDEKSHPAGWVNALLPLTPEDNLEEISKVHVIG
eukprot:13609487-Ditylum_brightwellii.AAC.1